MTEAGLEALRRVREARGLSLEAVSEVLRVPVPTLRAIEEGRLADLPPGPYRVGHIRAYFAYLGLTPDAAVEGRLRGTPSPPRAAPSTALWPVRLIAGATVLLLLLLLFLDPSSVGSSGADAVPTASQEPDQEVEVLARRNTRLKVLVDGEVVLDRRVPGGERVEVAGHRRVEVHLEAVEAARVEYNGEVILPQGRQDTPRRLVFVDDLDP